jgi:sulfur relay (sulfurtransferase) DsrC/TusE family protein
MEKEIEDVDKYYKKKSYYSNLKKKQIIKIRKDNTLNKEEKTEKAKKIKLPCLFCKKMIGTIFEKKDNHLIYRCGGEAGGCGNIVKIKLYAHTSGENIKKLFYDEINELKEKIIKLKCSLLFNYVNKEVAIERFEKFNKELSINSEIYLHTLRKYNNHVSNINFIDDELEEMVKEHQTNVLKIKDYFEKYKTDPTQAYLTDIVTIYKTILKPLNDNIRNKKYKNMEVIIEEENGRYISKLKYNTHNPADIEEFYDLEEEKVVKQNEPIVNTQLADELIEPINKVEVKDNLIYYNNKIILNKRNYEENKDKLENMDELENDVAKSKNYIIETIYESEDKAELVAIDPDTGISYKITS